MAVAMCSMGDKQSAFKGLKPVVWHSKLRRQRDLKRQLFGKLETTEGPCTEIYLSLEIQNEA
jgi:hypothetical protein